MKFADIRVSSELKNRLINHIDSGRVAHAQMFEGSNGFMPLPLALAYAQYLNCEQPTNGDSCGVCRHCRMIDALEYPDLYFVYPVGVPQGKKGKKDDFDSSDFIADWRKIFRESKPTGVFTENEWYEISGIGGEKGNTQGSIGRSDSDLIMEKMNYPPVENGFRVFIIWLPERMNNVSANALLKLFEEPSDKTIFIFVSEDSGKVLPTIKSRTQSLTIPPLNKTDIRTFLINDMNVDSPTADAIAVNAAGSIITARTMYLSINNDDETLEMFVSLMRLSYKSDYVALIDWAENFTTLNREQQKQFFRESVKVLRSAYMRAKGMTDIIYSFAKEMEFVSNFHQVINDRNIEPLIKEFEQCFKELQQNGNSKIVTTHFALSLSKTLRIK